MKSFSAFCVILLVLPFTIASNLNQDWDLAVAVSSHIELLDANGTSIGRAKEGFVALKAMTFDSIRLQFLVSDMDGKLDTIYAVNLNKETDLNNSVVAGLTDDVQGLAIDPIEDILYWTDAYNRTINYVSLQDGQKEVKNLFAFNDERPQGIAIDVCNRYLYWTNSDVVKTPTIERTKLGSTEREVIVNTDLILPAGITIDYQTQRIYWADMRGGIYYRIESTNFLGNEREIVYEGFNSKPFGIAVKNEILYFTDSMKKALFKFNITEKEQPEIIRTFEEEPRGLIAYKFEIRKLPDCKILDRAVKENQALHKLPKTNKNITIVKNIESNHIDISRNEIKCLNGNLTNGLCKCELGFSGTFCEISLCHNYCLRGTCHLSHLGYPTCRCALGFGGSRCEKSCDGFCLNGGKCRYNENARTPVCMCPEGFYGNRCTKSTVTDNLCRKFCNGVMDSEDQQEEYTFCKCSMFTNTAPQTLYVEENDISHYFDDPIFVGMLCIIFLAMLVCIVLTVCIIQIRKRPAPRIRRRYIVNKNVSSLTERPHPTEQCEITIENCCNMNVCETPCFEPSKLQSYQSRNEDKKLLLANMEKADDLY